MGNFKIKGLGELQKTLEEAKRAAESLGGEIAKLKVNPDNPQAAISEMERAVDAKLSRYRGNPVVEQLAAAAKKQGRDAILKRAEEAKRKAGK